MNPGYIYILQNPSLSESHLKIGRTGRDPEERAAEISRATGVPTPFEVVWWSESVDCHLAESILHHHLDIYRTNTTREFFDLEIDEAIRVAERAIRQSGGRSAGIAYSLRRISRWTFHALIRPLLRFPVQLILLAGLITCGVIKSTHLLMWGVVRGVLSILAALFAPRRGQRKSRRKKAAHSSGSQRRRSLVEGNDFYLKETVGAALWISLTYFVFYADGVSRCREILSPLFKRVDHANATVVLPIVEVFRIDHTAAQFICGSENIGVPKRGLKPLLQAHRIAKQFEVVGLHRKSGERLDHFDHFLS